MQADDWEKLRALDTVPLARPAVAMPAVLGRRQLLVAHAGSHRAGLPPDERDQLDRLVAAAQTRIDEAAARLDRTQLTATVAAIEEAHAGALDAAFTATYGVAAASDADAGARRTVLARAARDHRTGQPAPSSDGTVAGAAAAVAAARIGELLAPDSLARRARVVVDGLASDPALADDLSCEWWFRARWVLAGHAGTEHAGRPGRALWVAVVDGPAAAYLAALAHRPGVDTYVDDHPDRPVDPALVAGAAGAGCPLADAVVLADRVTAGRTRATTAVPA